MGEGLCNQEGFFQLVVLSGKTPGRVLNLKKNPGEVLSRGGFFQLLHRVTRTLTATQTHLNLLQGMGHAFILPGIDCQHVTAK